MEQTPSPALRLLGADQMNAHLSADDLSGMVDGRLPSARRAIVEAHLAICADCRAELVSASAIVESAPEARVRPSRWAGRGMVAAAAVLAILIVPRLVRRVPPAPTGERAGAGSAATTIALVNPTPRVSVDRDSLRFIWHGMPGSSYRLFVIDSVGEKLFVRTTTDTVVIPPTSLKLVSGVQYFWYVDALRPDGTAPETAPSGFRIRGR
jgi:hypothetical protein